MTRLLMRDGSGNVFFRLMDVEASLGLAAPEFLPPGRWLAAPVCWGGQAALNTTAPTPGEAHRALAAELHVPADQLVPYDEFTRTALKGTP